MATMKKNVWFAALDSRGNIVEDSCGLALMGKKKADVQEEVNCYYPATKSFGKESHVASACG